MKLTGLAAEIRSELGRKRMRFTELSGRTSIPMPQLSSQLRHETRSITWSDVYLIADALGIDPHTLVANAGEQPDVDAAHFVYRSYAEDGSLLYVGATVDPHQRMTDHRCNSAWYPFMASHTIERHPSRQAALKAEGEAIRDEFPKFNIRNGAA